MAPEKLKIKLSLGFYSELSEIVDTMRLGWAALSDGGDDRLRLSEFRLVFCVLL